MNDRKKVYYFKKKEIPYFIAYFLMAFSNVVIANSYLFGENRYDICCRDSTLTTLARVLFRVDTP